MTGNPAFDELLDDLVAETASLRRLVSGLPAVEWERATPAAGWAIRDQISHLAYFDEAALLALTDPEGFRAAEAVLRAGGGDFADAVAASLRHLTGGELLAWWDRARAGLLRGYRSDDPRRRIPWYGPGMSVMSAATARLMEAWAHGVDVADALGVPLEDSPRLRHVAHLGVRTMGFSFAHHGQAVPSTPVRVELAGSGGQQWVFGPPEAPDRVSGPALDFCLVVTQRRHLDDTALAVTGPVAAQWLSIAQAYAGPPTVRPAPAGAPAALDAAALDPALSRNLIQRVNVGDLLTRSTRRAPGTVAVVDGDARYTYAEFNSWVNRVAHGLSAGGYRRGDRLGLMSANRAEFLVVYFACAKLGVVCVPVNLGWRPDEVTYVLGHCAARGVVVETHRLDGLAPSLMANPGLVHVVTLASPSGGGTSLSVPGPSSGGDHLAGRKVETLAELAAGMADHESAAVVDDRDAISFLYTSGTTTAPKGVEASHLAVYTESLSMALECHFDGTDRFVAMMPLFHTAQLNVHCTPAIAVGATIHVRDGFDAGGLLEQIEREGITQIFGLPMMYRAMLDHPDVARRDLSTLRRALYAMAPMPDTDLRRAIETFDCDFYLLFGQTEMSPATTIFRPEHQLSHSGAVGTPVVNVEVAIMGGDGDLLPTGGEGEIVYRGPHTMTGYLDNPQATDAAFAHGWFHSGDVGAFDPDGVLWFRDRFKDVIKTGGENVASLEVEKAILTHIPAVADVAIIGLRHDYWSEAITAFVVPRPGDAVDLEDLRRGLRGHLDSYKIPKGVIVIQALPRTSTGKIRKNLLREEYGDFYERA